MSLVQAAIAVVLVFAANGAPGAWANEGEKSGKGASHRECESFLTEDGLHITGDELPGSVGERLRNSEDLKILYKPSGVLDRLGLPKPQYHARLLSPNGMSQVAPIGRYPIGTWTDGMALVTQGWSSLSTLEFVEPGRAVSSGCPVCRGFHNASLKYWPQMSIFHHVIGHNTFSLWSPHFAEDRVGDAPNTSRQLNRFLKTVSKVVPPQELRAFLELMPTLEHLQDYVGGSFVSPEYFDRSRHLTDPNRSSGGLAYSQPENWPPYPTSNILQFLVHNLPNGAPYWQREILTYWEKMGRHRPGIVKTKHMNEGLATLFMHVLAGHTPGRGTEGELDIALLLSGVACQKRFSNPYYLGREGWRNIQKDVEARPELQGVDAETRDRAFMKQAEEIVHNTYSDRQFYQKALSDRWITDQDLAIVKPVDNYYNWDPRLPPPTERENNYQWEVVTRSIGQVRDSIINQVTNIKNAFPSIFLENENAFGQGVFHLRHEVYDNMPLRRKSAAKALYQFAKLVRRPVMIETIGSTSWQVPGIDLLRPDRPATSAQDAAWDRLMAQPDPRVGFPGGSRLKFLQNLRAQGSPTLQLAMNLWGGPPAPPQVSAFPLRIRVDAAGRVQVEVKKAEDPAAEWQRFEPLEQELQAELDAFIEDQTLNTDPDFVAREGRRLGMSQLQTDAVMKFSNEIADDEVAKWGHLDSEVEGAADAVSAYVDLFRRRVSARVLKAISGGANARSTGQGLIVRVMPEVPAFEFDRSAAEALNSALDAQGSVSRDARKLQVVSLKDFGIAAAKDNGRIGKVGGKPGDKFWGPNPNGEQGSGNGSGDDDADGSDGDEPGEGNRPGKGGQGPRPGEIFIPAETLQKLLRLELPNSKKRQLGDPEFQMLKDDSAYRKGDDIKWNRMQKKLIQLGVSALMLERPELRGMPVNEILERLKQENNGILPIQLLVQKGLPMLQEQHYVTYDSVPEPEPQQKAVFVIAADQSGSMQAYIKLLREFCYQMRVLLKSQYKSIEIVWVGFDTEAVEYASEDEFFESFKGGGTSYTSGATKVVEVLSRPQYGNMDKYTLIGGDAGTSAEPEFMQELEKIRDKLNYGAFLLTGPEGAPDFLRPIKDAAKKDNPEWFGYAEVDHQPNKGIIRALLTLFGKDRAKYKKELLGQ